MNYHTVYSFPLKGHYSPKIKYPRMFGVSNYWDLILLILFSTVSFTLRLLIKTDTNLDQFISRIILNTNNYGKENST